MFYCQVTGKLSKPGDKLFKVVVEKRDRVYTKQVKNETTRQWETIEVGYGWEIVKTMNATEEGVKSWETMTPEDRKALLENL